MDLNRIAVILALAGLMLLGGCNQYVNIPAEPGDGASHDPTHANVTNVSIASLRAVLADQAIQGRYQVVLPAGTLGSQYQEVIAALGGGATLPIGPNSRLPALEIHKVHITTTAADVEVIRPGLGTNPKEYRQLVTLSLDWDPVNGWTVDKLRPWHISLEDALKADAAYR